MTVHAYQLVDSLHMAALKSDSIRDEWAALKAYIEELESKAKAYDAIVKERASNPFPPPHPGTRRDA